MRVCHLSLDKLDLSSDSLNEGQVHVFHQAPKLGGVLVSAECLGKLH